MGATANEHIKPPPKNEQEKAVYIDNYRSLQLIVEKQEKDITSLRNTLISISKPPADRELDDVKKGLKSIEDERAYFSYADMVAISLACVSVLITILGIVIAILSFWGYKNIQKAVQIQAAEVANTHAANAVPLALSSVASEELKKIIENGHLNAQLQDAVDMILRREQPPDKSKVSQLLSELDEGERDEE